MSDAAAREALANARNELSAMLSGAPTPPLEEERIGLFPLRGARVLPDGRLGAIVEWAGFDDLRRVSESNFHIFALVDGRWLLDEEISFIPHP